MSYWLIDLALNVWDTRPGSAGSRKGLGVDLVTVPDRKIYSLPSLGQEVLLRRPDTGTTCPWRRLLTTAGGRAVSPRAGQPRGLGTTVAQSTRPRSMRLFMSFSVFSLEPLPVLVKRCRLGRFDSPRRPSPQSYLDGRDAQHHGLFRKQ